MRSKIALWFIHGFIFAAITQVAAAQEKVLLITIDGVRWQDVLSTPDPAILPFDSQDNMPNLKNKFVHEGVLLGMRDAGNLMSVSNSAVKSLPAYQHIYAGEKTTCASNYCGQTRVETFAERLVKDLGLDPKSVAVIGSWPSITLAATSALGVIFTNSGLLPLKDGFDDQELKFLNSEQGKHRPFGAGTRTDRFTMAHAERYLRMHQPRFLHVALNDADEHGHDGDFRAYIEALRSADAWIAKLIALLDEHTTLIVTTDHGRGNGPKEWQDHSSRVRGADAAWLYARGPHTPKTGILGAFRDRTHLDIRPTIETLMGLQPKSCPNGCGGMPMSEIIAL